MSNFLFLDDRPYLGQYVTFTNMTEKTVVSVDASPVQAVKKAREKGYLDTVLVYIPDEQENEFLL